VSANLLQTLKILTELVVQSVSNQLARLAVAVVLLTVEEPLRDLVLARVGHDVNNLLDLEI